MVIIRSFNDDYIMTEKKQTTKITAAKNKNKTKQKFNVLSISIYVK